MNGADTDHDVYENSASMALTHCWYGALGWYGQIIGTAEEFNVAAETGIHLVLFNDRYVSLQVPFHLTSESNRHNKKHTQNVHVSAH
jgi:hypothetical protein